MSSASTNLKVGIFVIGSALLGIGGTILLGSNTLFQHVETIETYSLESVNGLTEGSPVKFRGVTIGEVSRITFVDLVYDRAERPDMEKLDSAVLIRMKLVQDLIGIYSDADFATDVQYAVDHGMRARMVTAGITGGLYVELEYLASADAPHVAVTWDPEYPYVPSATSRLDEFLNGLEQIVGSIRKVDFEEIGAGIQRAVAGINAAIDADGKPMLAEARTFVQELRDNNGRLRALLEDPDVRASIANVESTTASLAEIFGEEKAGLKEALSRFPTIVANVEKASASIDRILAEGAIDRAIAGIGTAADKAGPALDDVRGLVDRVDRFVAGEENDLRALVQSLRAMTENLEALSARLRSDAPQVLFGEPPPRLAPGQTGRR